MGKWNWILLLSYAFGYKINSRKRKLSPYHSVMPAISIFSGRTEMTCRNVFLHLDRVTCIVGQYFLFMGSFCVLWADKAFWNVMACLESPYFLGGQMCRCNLWWRQKPIRQRKTGPLRICLNDQFGAWGCTWTYPDPALLEGWGSLGRDSTESDQKELIMRKRVSELDHENLGPPHW